MNPTVSVIMPTYNQAHFIRRALRSLCDQTLQGWELIIIDDASTDETPALIRPFLDDKRIKCIRLPENSGRGAAINAGLDVARAPFIAYLPSDDVYYSDHLTSLTGVLAGNPAVPLAFSGVRFKYNKLATGKVPIPKYSLQMVQVMHRRTSDRWPARLELESDDLEMLFWHKFRPLGEFAATEQISCEWVDHPGQLHKLLQEPIGGINPYRQRFNVQHPLRFHTTQGNFIDEVRHYRRYRERPDTPKAADGLKILLVGELAYNADRVLALEERGHKLYGLWMPDPYWYNAVGPLPFGHVEDLPRHDWQAAIRRIQPDIIYALLNWQAVPFVHEVFKATPHLPKVWHFKEGPFISLEHGQWAYLEEVHRMADGQIFSSIEMLDWTETAIPGVTCNSPKMVLDGDLPKRDWFDGQPSPRLSAMDGELHTVVPGRPIGLHSHTVGELAQEGIHLHFYGDFTQGQWAGWVERAMGHAPNHLHLHPQVDQDGWLREFSQYDAGWLHWLKSENGGDIRRSNWDDLNLPARLATLIVSGLPVLQYDNAGAVVATQTVVRRHDAGLFFSSLPELREKLSDKARMAQVRENVWRVRHEFMFDTHAGRLIDFFRQVITAKNDVAREMAH